jgi:hypothetical protein
VKLKLKPSRNQLVLVGVVAALLVALVMGRASRDPAGDGPGRLDDAAKSACSDFAAGYGRADSRPDRLALADRVTPSSSRSDNRTIAERAAEMGRRADDGGSAWRSASDALLGACRDAGWVG